VLLAIAIVFGALHGVVTRGPITPVCQVGIPCSAPAVGAVLLFSQRGQIVAHVRTRSGGRYSVRLAAGAYTVGLSPAPRIGFGLRPSLVRIRPRRNARLDFSVDTGIR
jgi:hypothetical protein